MNFQLLDNILERQRCRHWTPLPTEQLRLRHLYQITAYNLQNESINGVYYTLHTAAMCAPFYTSEIIYSANPRWVELEVHNLSNISSTAFVIRIWQKKETDDKILLTWGINLSGLAYLGNKISDIQPESFFDNTVILYLRGGFFTYFKYVRNDLDKPLPFIHFFNVISDTKKTYVYKILHIKCVKNETKSSYNIDKLRRLHSLQISIKNKSLDVQMMKDTIKNKNGFDQNQSIDVSTNNEELLNSTSNVRYAPQLLTMVSLNRMLEDKPTKVQKCAITRIQKEIENTKLKTKILLQERDRKNGQIRQLKLKYTELCDSNEERNSNIMENYHTLSKDIERLRDWKKEQFNQKELVNHTSLQLQHRRRQLMSELLYLYPIERLKNNKYLINGLYLPSSDMLTDCSDGGLSIALGYVTHLLIMCASILQVPLRYPMNHFGSRSVIEDHITSSLSERSREFPLYTRGKDRMQFNYAVYLLNKNIAQYLLLLGAKTTPDLKATLPNMLALLQGKGRLEPINKPLALMSTSSTITADGVSVCSQETTKIEIHHLENRRPFSGSNGNISDPILDSLRHECHLQRSQSPNRVKKKTMKNSECGPGLSQILAIPEAFLNRQISCNSFKNYMHTSVTILENSGLQQQQENVTSINDIEIVQESSKKQKSCDKLNISNSTNIEQGTEMMAPEATTSPIIKSPISNLSAEELKIKKSKRLSRSVGSYTDEHLELRNSFELGSDPLLNVSSDTNNSLLKNYNIDDLTGNADAAQNEFLQKWLDSGPALICSEENLYPEEILGSMARCSTSNNHTDTKTDLNCPKTNSANNISSNIVNSNSNIDSPLTLRTDALLKTKSFNLVKPKFN